MGVEERLRLIPRLLHELSGLLAPRAGNDERNTGQRLVLSDGWSSVELQVLEFLPDPGGVVAVELDVGRDLNGPVSSASCREGGQILQTIDGRAQTFRALTSTRSPASA